MKTLLLMASLLVAQAATQDTTRPNGVRVRGRVTFASSTVAAEPIRVALQPRNGGTLIEVALATGATFEFPSVPPGSYTLSLVPPPTLLVPVVVAATDIDGLEIRYLDRSGFPSSPLNVPGPTTPLVPRPDSVIVSISQSGRYPSEWREGAQSYYRIERAGTLVEEKLVEGRPLTFILAPGNYELRGYSRGCNGNCRRLTAPEVPCTVPLTVTAGNVLYAERVFQGTACTIRFNPPPR